MTAVIGIALLVAGCVLSLVGRPGREQEMRPIFQRSAFLHAVYPTLCLACLTFGCAMVLTSVL